MITADIERLISLANKEMLDVLELFEYKATIEKIQDKLQNYVRDHYAVTEYASFLDYFNRFITLAQYKYGLVNNPYSIGIFFSFKELMEELSKSVSNEAICTFMETYHIGPQNMSPKHFIKKEYTVTIATKMKNLLEKITLEEIYELQKFAISNNLHDHQYFVDKYEDNKYFYVYDKNKTTEQTFQYSSYTFSSSLIYLVSKDNTERIQENVNRKNHFEFLSEIVPELFL